LQNIFCMKVVLLKNVKEIGLEGTVVEVSEGYARNFLFPQNLAVQASEQAIKAAQDKKVRVAKKEKKELVGTKKMAAKLDGVEVLIKAKVNEKGSLFGAVNPKEIVKALKAQGFVIEPEWILISEPIKEIGKRRLIVDLPHGLEAEIEVIIEKE